MLKEQYDKRGICVPAGFLYDGASIPRFCWSLIGLSPFGAIIGPATIHDFLYVNGGIAGRALRLTKRETDELFYELMLEAGISKIKAKAAYQAVHMFGRGEF